MSGLCKVKNAMTVDVEDYYHVSAFSNKVKFMDWNKYESRVVFNTNNILELFDKYNIKSTFFILGWVAEKYPHLVRKIAGAGHEVASHGYSHQLIYKQGKNIFKEETLRSKAILENESQTEVLGYRAASYSITSESLWALDILIDAGFKYDSSIFPIYHDRYGIPNAKIFPHRLQTINNKEITEFPLTTQKFMGLKLPAAGGGYFRIYPYFFSKYLLRKRCSKNNTPFIFYFHPWEVDPEQPRIKAGIISRFRHYNNLRKCKDRIEMLLTDFKFTTACDVLKYLELL